VRSGCAALCDEGRRRDAEQFGALRGIAAEAAQNQKLIAASDRVHRVQRWVLAILEKADDHRLTNRDLTLKIASRDRPALADALRLAQQNQLIRLAPDGVTWEKL
jgi:hypothetical protein